jgi:hypothetical protein
MQQIFFFFFFLKSSISWHLMVYSSAEVTRHFGGTYRLHLQGITVGEASNKHEVGSKFLLADPEIGGDVPPKRLLTHRTTRRNIQ